MVAVLYRARIFVDEGRLAIAEFAKTLVHVFNCDFGSGVFHFHAFVFGGFEFRIDLKLRLKTERFAVVKMNVGNIGLAHDPKVLFLRFGVEELRHEGFQNLLADFAGKTAAHQRKRDFARPEARHAGPLLEYLSDLTGLCLDCPGGNRNLKLVLTAFYECQPGLPRRISLGAFPSG